MPSAPTAVDFRRVVVGVFENRQTAQHLAGIEYLAAHAANHLLQAEPEA